jgi:nucleotide-binding universal stress UspA family protein
MSIDMPAAPQRVIVVGVDGSEQSTVALRWAGRVAAATGSSIDVVGVWHVPMVYGWAGEPDEWIPGADAEKCLTEAVDAVFGTERPAGLRLIVREGSAAERLLEQSEGALMLVLGSRGLGGFAGMLLGSVSASCVHHATCPVLVIRGDSLPAEG